MGGGGGGVGLGGGGQVGCEAFVIFFGGVGLGGVRMDVNGEVKLL